MEAMVIKIPDTKKAFIKENTIEMFLKLESKNVAHSLRLLMCQSPLGSHCLLAICPVSPNITPPNWQLRVRLTSALVFGQK